MAQSLHLENFSGKHCLKEQGVNIMNLKVFDKKMQYLQQQQKGTKKDTVSKLPT